MRKTEPTINFVIQRISEKSLKGTNKIAGGTAPGKIEKDSRPCKGRINHASIRPLQGRTISLLFRGRCPRLFYSSLSGTFQIPSLTFRFLSSLFLLISFLASASAQYSQRPLGTQS